ncbi:ArsR family transcriptional regulator [Metallosphaera sedula]|uniref:ArsR family transcriptional regulator n=1 Tax=Metallosphaera sedula TaxID=43687 RepID=UPI0020BFC1DC|nr:HTH domain-containing protein [Metallosphaera sedula]BBL48326.1 hypothetical protein MJ1HA_2448 [Metallosphaera sedula]
MEFYPLYETNPSLREIRNVCFRLGKERLVFTVLEELRRYNLGFGKLAALAYFCVKDRAEAMKVAKELNVSPRELSRAERELRRRMKVYKAMSSAVLCPRCLSYHVVSKGGRTLCKSCGRTFTRSFDRRLAWRIFLAREGTLRTRERSVEEVAKELKVSKKTVVKYLKILKKLYLEA